MTSSDAGATSSSISSPTEPSPMPMLLPTPSLTLSPVSITSDNSNHRPFAGGLLRSTPLELQATVPEYMIPFVPILERGEEPFAMFRDLWTKHSQWVLDPIRYSSADRLIEVL